MILDVSHEGVHRVTPSECQTVNLGFLCPRLSKPPYTIDLTNITTSLHVQHASSKPQVKGRPDGPTTMSSMNSNKYGHHLDNATHISPRAIFIKSYDSGIYSPYTLKSNQTQST